MSEAIFDTMGAVLARWTMGSVAAPAAAMWRAELGTEPQEAELRLLALSAQFLGVAVTAEPPAGLRALPDIPALALPTVPEASRPLVRRLLAAMKETWAKAEILRFLAARGWTVHPGDWMPPANDEDAPDVYAPWRDWAEIAASSVKLRRQSGDRITAENWEDYWPAARKMALTELRQRDPSAARLVLEAKLAGENADVRLRLLGLLAVGLSDGDIPFLESIVTADRAPKVKAWAESLLARLGRGARAGADIAELKGFFSVEVKGLLRRSRLIRFENARTPAQLQRRAALLEVIDVASFAEALGLTFPELIAGWVWDQDPQADVAFIALMVRTGPDALVELAAETLGQRDSGGLQGLVSLAPRMTPGQRAALAATALGRHGCSFEMAKTIAGGTARLEDPLATSAGEALLTALRREDAKPSDQLAELHALGLLASHVGARQVLARLNGTGLLQGDPRLDTLRLNDDLDDKGSSQ